VFFELDRDALGAAQSTAQETCGTVDDLRRKRAVIKVRALICQRFLARRFFRAVPQQLMNQRA